MTHGRLPCHGLLNTPGMASQVGRLFGSVTWTLPAVRSAWIQVANLVQLACPRRHSTITLSGPQSQAPPPRAHLSFLHALVTSPANEEAWQCFLRLLQEQLPQRVAALRRDLLLSGSSPLVHSLAATPCTPPWLAASSSALRHDSHISTIQQVSASACELAVEGGSRDSLMLELRSRVEQALRQLDKPVQRFLAQVKRARSAPLVPLPETLASSPVGGVRCATLESRAALSQPVEADRKAHVQHQYAQLQAAQAVQALKHSLDASNDATVSDMRALSELPGWWVISWWARYLLPTNESVRTHLFSMCLRMCT
jgi:hypothetical protein